MTGVSRLWQIIKMVYFIKKKKKNARLNENPSPVSSPLHVIAGRYLCTGSRRTRHQRTAICRRAVTWRNSSSCGRGPGTPAPRSGSSGRTASTCSGCARDRIYSSQAPVARRFGIVPLQKKKRRRSDVIIVHNYSYRAHFLSENTFHVDAWVEPR